MRWSETKGLGYGKNKIIDWPQEMQQVGLMFYMNTLFSFKLS